MEIQQLVSKTPAELREYCESLSDEDKQNLYEQYKQTVDDAKGKSLEELLKLSKLATAIERTMDKKLLDSCCSDDHPFHPLASFIFLNKLSRRFTLIMHSSCDKNFKELDELDKLLPKMYEELKPKLRSDMQDYVEKELRFSNFLRENIETFKRLEEAKHGPIEKRREATIGLTRLLLSQSELSLEGNIFLLDLISQHIGDFRKYLKRQMDASVSSLENSLGKLIELKDSTEEYREMENKMIDEINEIKGQLRGLVLGYAIFYEAEELLKQDKQSIKF